MGTTALQPLGSSVGSKDMNLSVALFVLISASCSSLKAEPLLRQHQWPGSYLINTQAKLYPVVDFTHHAHDAFGKAQFVDSKTIHLTELFYDGAGPKTNWIVGTKSPIGIDSNTYIIDELTADGAVKYSVTDLSSSVPSLSAFDSDSFILSLPIVGGKQLTWEDVTWVALYCRQVNMLFMDVKTQDLMNVSQ